MHNFMADHDAFGRATKFLVRGDTRTALWDAKWRQHQQELMAKLEDL